LLHLSPQPPGIFFPRLVYRMADPSPELAAQLQTLASSYAENPGRFFVPYAGLLREAGQREQAEEILRENIKKFPGLSAHVLLGRCLADRGAHPEASNEFHYVLSIDSQNLIALRTLAEMAAADGRTDEAHRWYGELLSVDPMNAEARAAVGRLGAPGPDAATADQPAGADAAWGGADDSGAGTLEGPAEEPADELEWGNLDLDAPAAGTEEEPAEESGVPELGFGEVELGGELPDLPWSGGEARQDLGEAEHGELPLLDFGSAAEEEDAAGEPAPLPSMEEEPEVVTETMAELYASQGLPDRAAEVYRELIERRGREPGLLRRLAELEGGELEGGVETAPAAERDDFAESVSAGFVPGDAAPAPEERAGWEVPEVTEADEAAGFDLVVIDDSMELDGDAHPPASAEVAAELSADWAVAAAPLEEQEDAVESASAARTMRGYFDALLGWAPAEGSAAAAPPVPAEPAEDRDAEEPVFAVELEEPSAEPEEPVFAVELEEPAPAAEPEEALPWELPAEAPAVDAHPEPEPEPAPVADGGFSFEDFFAGEPEPEAEAAAAPPPAPSAPAPAPGGTEAAGAPAAGGEEDEDLESFQAWLQSLKR
jgi:tetratricopeptide (TPR) repeat protein